jgi:hypothetical protein
MNEQDLIPSRKEIAPSVDETYEFAESVIYTIGEPLKTEEHYTCLV